MFLLPDTPKISSFRGEGLVHPQTPMTTQHHWQNLPFCTMLHPLTFATVWLCNMLEKRFCIYKCHRSEDEASKHRRPAVGTNSTMEQGAGAEISMLLTRSPPSLITRQALSASGESLYYFQVSPIVSHCDKEQDDLTQWWITPDIEFSRGCQAISVGCITWKCHKIQTRTKEEFGINSADSGYKQGSWRAGLGSSHPHISVFVQSEWNHRVY